MKIYVGADHNGFHLKEQLINHLKKSGYSVVDKGDKQLDPEDDFPVFARRVVMDVLSSDDSDPRGLLLCGSGQGMCIAANRFKKVRASVIWSVEEARLSRNDDNSNIICLPSKIVLGEDIKAILHTWLTTPFADAPRFNRRIEEMDKFGV